MKIYYSLQEAARETNLPVSTIRYWECIPDVHPRKDGHGNRYYTEDDLTLLKRIKFIRDELHITRIEAIQKELHSDNKKSDAKQRASEILLRVKDELIALRELI